uniref:Uncharacterized protein n=1 Tax=Glossina palpalis gambiensis TaxID=67801 RepID=A0A1B0BR37_9MUSC
MEELSLNYLLYTGPKFCFLLSLVDIKHSDYVTTNVYCRLHIIRLECLQKEKKGCDKLRTYQLPNNSKNARTITKNKIATDVLTLIANLVKVINKDICWFFPRTS